MMHKRHHDFNETVSIAALQSYPLEFAIGVNFPFFTGMFILGDKFHFSTMVLWALLRFHEAYEEHCGYEFPWSFFRLLPWAADSTTHHYHHNMNVGNFGNYTIIWDLLFDTTSDYYETHPKGARAPLPSTPEDMVKKDS